MMSYLNTCCYIDPEVFKKDKTGYCIVPQLKGEARKETRRKLEKGGKESRRCLHSSTEIWTMMT